MMVEVTTPLPQDRPAAKRLGAADVSSRCVMAELPDMAAILQACELVDGIWLTAGLLPPNMVRAIQHAGGYVAGAWLDGQLVGVSVGFLGSMVRHGRPVPTLHSHVTGVTVPHRGIGAALKHHQRAWCRDRGIEAVTWTFDPLVARNGWFNVVKLGAVGVAYLQDHYGPMPDGFNAGDASDRLLAWWPSTDPLEDRGSSDGPELVPPGTPHLLRRGSAGDPERGTGVVDLPAGGVLAVALPTDILALRADDPPLAARWRAAVRHALGGAMADGWVVTGMARDAHYLLTRSAEETP